MKKCGRCKEILPVKNFTRNVSRSDGLSPTCKYCQKEYRDRVKETNRKLILDPGLLKWCSGCQVKVPLSNFYADISKTYGVSTFCKPCVKSKQSSGKGEYMRVYREKNRNAERPLIVRKICSFCKIDKPIEEFYVKISNKDGYRERCIKCTPKVNPEVNRAIAQRRRARKRGAIVPGEREPNARELAEFYGKSCLFPGCDSENPTIDHIIPLVHGGKHIFENSQPLCARHNSQKSDKSIDYRINFITAGKILDK